MDIEEKRNRALDFLYDFYAETGQREGYIHLEAAQAATGLHLWDLAHAFRELVDDGLAAGHPAPGKGMRPEDGFVWVASEGRKAVEERRRAAAAVPEPTVVHVLFAGFTDEGQRHYLELLKSVGDEERERYQALLTEVADDERPEADRVEKAETLVSLVQASWSLTAALVGAAAPQAAPFFARLFGG